MQHEQCVCGLNEIELALMNERDRLAQIVDKWMDEVNQALGTNICIDGLYYDSDWFPDRPTCKLEMER